MSTLPVVFAMVIVVPTLGVGIAVWWMHVSPRYRPTSSRSMDGRDHLLTKVLLGVLVLVLVLFGPVAQLAQYLWYST